LCKRDFTEKKEKRKRKKRGQMSQLVSDWGSIFGGTGGDPSTLVVKRK
jgi:hypothetical protein